MEDNKTVMESVEEGLPELKNKLVRLTDQLVDVKKRKKAADAGFNAEIRDLEEMIKATMENIRQKESDEPGLLG